jgi:hypothetical protein
MSWIGRRWIARAGLAAMLMAGLATDATAQRTHVLLVAGLAGEPSYGPVFRDAVTTIAEAARTSWSVPEASLFVLTDDGRAASRSSRENIERAIVAIGQRAAAGDVILIVLVGHGGGEGAASRVNLPGPDPTAADYAAWLSGFTRQRVVFVNASSGSGDFLPVLAAPQRVIVTATRSAMQRNESVFASFFARGIGSSEADADKDGRVSVLEAFTYANREVARVYDSSNRMQTEQAQISDSTLARSIAFGGPAPSTDPRVASLVAERQALEAQVGALRLRKASMNAAMYERELERLLLAIAEKTQAIRQAGGRE